MANAEKDTALESERPRIPRRVPDGGEDLESLGWFVDDVIMGHARTDRRIAREMEPYLLGEDEMPDDPPPSQAPPPVPGGDEPIAKGDDPEGEKRG